MHFQLQKIEEIFYFISWIDHSEAFLRRFQILNDINLKFSPSHVLYDKLVTQAQNQNMSACQNTPQKVKEKCHVQLISQILSKKC